MGEESTSFPVVSDHYYVLQLHMTPTDFGKLKLEEFDLSKGNNLTSLASVSNDLLTFV